MAEADEISEISDIDFQKWTRQNLPLWHDDILNNNLPKVRIGRRRPAPTTSLGWLGLLPLELLQEVLANLDVWSLETFRRVNRQSDEAVLSLPEMKIIKAHASHALRCVLSIGTGRWIGCRDLYNSLCTPFCEQCGKFAGALYLLTCRRACFYCIRENEAYLPISPTSAALIYGISRRQLQGVPCMKTFPGTYGPGQKQIGSIKLVDRRSARAVGIAHHGSVEAMKAFVAAKNARKMEAYEARRRAAKGNQSREVRRPQTEERDVVMWPHHPRRYVAFSRVTWFDKKQRKAEWGYYCSGCNGEGELLLYTRKSFVEHIRQLGRLQRPVGREYHPWQHSLYSFDDYNNMQRG